MSGRKTDTNRISECETESETIDDFSQYSEPDEFNKIHRKPSFDSRSETPVLRKTSLNINTVESIPVDVKNIDELSMNEEEKDNSEDILVEISKKTTIKKIISRTTSVNGITQSSETEEIILRDSHTSERPRESCPLLGKTSRSTNSFDLTDNVKDNLGCQSPSNTRSDSIHMTRVPLAFKENEINYQIDDNNETEIGKSKSNKEIDKDHDVKDSPSSAISSQKDTELPKQTSFIISDEIIKENERERPSSLKQQYKPESQSYYLEKESKFMNGKRKESNGIINTNIYTKSRRLKSEKIDSIMTNKIDKYKNYCQTPTGRIRWTDPFKSYHLKYDLKDNGRSMQNWIKQKRMALDRSDPNQFLKNGKYPETRYPKSRSVNPYETKNKNRDEIKGYIVQGHLKENLFQIRHPYPESQKSSSHSPTKSNEKKPELTNSYKSFSIETKGSLNDLRKSLPNSTCNSYESRTSGLSQKVSKILNKCDLIKQDFNPLDLKFEEFRNSWHPNNTCKYNCEMNYFHNPICHCCCCCCSSLNCSFPMNYDCTSSTKYLSHESLLPQQSCSRKSKETNLLTSNHNRNQRQKTEKFTKAKDSRNGSCISTESLDSSQTISKKQIDYLENKLNTLENKLRKIKVNEKKSLFECELDLECQCQDIKKQLDYLYRAIPGIRGAA